MSTEPKYPKRRDNPTLGVSLTAPDGCYLLNAGEIMQAGDCSASSEAPTDWTPLLDEELGGLILRAWAWTYARRLPEGQLNDDDMPAPARRSGKWAYSTDEENFQGACDSAEAAFIEGADRSDLDDDQTLYVGQIDEPDPVPGITADRVLEWVEEYLGGEAPDSIGEILPRPSADQKAALEEALRSAYLSWLSTYPDQKPRWFRIKGKVLEKTGAEIRERYKPDA